jgi:hypothetical protein
MCQFTPLDPMRIHPVFTRCQYTGEVVFPNLEALLKLLNAIAVVLRLFDSLN